MESEGERKGELTRARENEILRRRLLMDLMRERYHDDNKFKDLIQYRMTTTERGHDIDGKVGL